MAKTLTLLLATTTLVASLLLFSILQTTTAVITNVARLSPHCRQQLQREKMDHCRQYLKTEMDILMHPNIRNQACCLRECCDMLQEMDEDCVCEALESVAEEDTERMSMRAGEGRRMGSGRVVVKKAMQLPGRCGIRAQCEDGSVRTTTSY